MTLESDDGDSGETPRLSLYGIAGKKTALQGAGETRNQDNQTKESIK